jgi:hypothetical protein
MSRHLTISPSEAADRLAIRELIEAYAHCADRRDGLVKMDRAWLFAERLLYMDWLEERALS